MMKKEKNHGGERSYDFSPLSSSPSGQGNQTNIWGPKLGTGAPYWLIMARSYLFFNLFIEAFFPLSTFLL